MLSERIKDLRKRRKLSQRELAEKLNVSQQTVGSWETGRSEPNSEMMVRLADYFGVTTDYILGRKIDLGNTPVAAHIIGDEPLTDEEQQEIDDYIEFKKAQFKKRHEKD